MQINNLDNNKIGNEGMKYLRDFKFEKLRLLNLSNNQIGDKGLKCFPQANFRYIETHNLHYNQIKDKGLEYLSKADFSNLIYLKLNLGNDGVKYLTHLILINL